MDSNLPGFTMQAALMLIDMTRAVDFNLSQ